ncbi:MAG: hypothetical protein P4N59_07520 [Negativicutes bacterium]|nr:hypothetical protein [Negativicutes bacterium]
MIYYKMLQQKPESFEVLCNGKYVGLLYYSWIDNLAGREPVKGWTFVGNGETFYFTRKKKATRFLSRKFNA